METREITGEVRIATNPDGGRTMTGYACRWDSLSQGLSYVEVFRHGAFNKTLQEADVVALASHDKTKPLGRMSSGTLRLEEDNWGLAFECDLDPSISYVGDLVKNIERHDIIGCSFGFRPIKSNRCKDGTVERLEVALAEISPTAAPAYQETSVAVRNKNGTTPKLSVAMARLALWGCR